MEKVLSQNIELFALGLYNLVAYYIFYMDCQSERAGGRTIPSIWLAFLSLSGGGIGALLGWWLYRRHSFETMIKVLIMIGAVFTIVVGALLVYLK